MNYVGVVIIQTSSQKVVYIVSGDRDSVFYGVPRALHPHMSLFSSKELFLDKAKPALRQIKKYCAGLFDALTDFESGKSNSFPTVFFECRS